MIQRHQIFVIARVCITPGERREYRCIAAVNHDGCRERGPLYGVNSFKRLVRVHANAALVEEELATYYERRDDLNHPCPYTSYLAESAFAIDLACGHRLIPYCSDSVYTRGTDTVGSNNSGVTILDVTIPTNPLYCFVWNWDLSNYAGQALREHLPLATPLRAAEYLRAYQPQAWVVARLLQFDFKHGEDERWNLEAIANLDDMPLIQKRTLGLVWPEEYGIFVDEEEAPESGGSGPSSDLNDLRQQASLSPEEVALITDTVRVEAEDSAFVDLSKFSLTPSQLFSILGELGTFRRLDISYNPAVDKDVLHNILKKFRSLSWINIMHCAITRDDLIELAQTSPQIFRGSIGGIIHPTFLSCSDKSDGLAHFPTAFRVCFIVREWYPRVIKFEFMHLPFFRLDELVQNLIDLVELVQGKGKRVRYGGLHPSVLASALRGPEETWHDRHIQIVPVARSAKPKYEPLKEGYELVIRTSLPEDLRYGIFPPLAPDTIEHTESDMMEMGEFLERLKEEGARLPSDGVAVGRLVELCSKMMKLPMEALKG